MTAETLTAQLVRLHSEMVAAELARLDHDEVDVIEYARLDDAAFWTDFRWRNAVIAAMNARQLIPLDDIDLTIRAARVAGMQERDVHWAEMFDDAVQGDCENGVRSLNEIAAKNYLKEAPLTREVINAIRAAADKLEAGE